MMHLFGVENRDTLTHNATGVSLFSLLYKLSILSITLLTALYLSIMRIKLLGTMIKNETRE
ncbi:hypothetical protein RchiOBHm_Chr4g0418761 [Rosa chinensis]|uniref:Uncharacterized protein n=1 Tax=Rosa chinensis TaxID=74649 RepID=A0A2P6QXF2_ROSCH|nr:hypothetical protein RchiOBHm_Chr4g0418761 [Rosa chinensis]